MKTLTTLAIASLFTMGTTLPVQANQLTDHLSTVVQTQLNELHSSIQQQARLALEHTVAELFFSLGNDTAKQQLNTSAEVAADAQAKDEDHLTEQPE